jgi:Spy/CpxP family protein refolding chaperone
MKTRTTLLLLTSLVALLVLPLAAQSAEKARDPREILTNPRLLARYLQLTPAQVATTQTLFKELQATVKPLREVQKGLYEAFYRELEAASPSPCSVGAAAIALHENKEKIKDAFEVFDQKFSAILTPEQLAKYEALKDAARLLGGRDDD